MSPDSIRIPDQYRREIAIRGRLAVWVLAVHLYATLVPLALSLSAYLYRDYLQAVTDYPGLFHVAAGLLCAGSAFEAGQNSIDRWYLTPDCGSANGTGFCDFLFYWFVTSGQAAIAIAIGGREFWVMALSLLTVAALPICYYYQRAHFAPLSIAGLLGAVLAWQTFGDPVVFLQFLLTGLTLYFYAALLRTGNQALHGWITLAASSGIWFLVVAIGNGAATITVGWPVVAGITIAAVALASLCWPGLLRLPATPCAE